MRTSLLKICLPSHGECWRIKHVHQTVIESGLLFLTLMTSSIIFVTYATLWYHVIFSLCVIIMYCVSRYDSLLAQK